MGDNAANVHGFTRLKVQRLRSTWFRPQWRKRARGKWQDVFVTPFSDKRQADVFRRREYPGATHIDPIAQHSTYS